jgi:hypothetical protein
MPADVDFTPHSFRFSTDALPANKRLPFWRDAFTREVVHADVKSRSHEPFRAKAIVQAIPGLRITSFTSTAACLVRSPEMIADGDDELVLLTPSQGQLCAIQREREVTLRPGEAVLLLHEEPAKLIHDRVRFKGLIFPRAALGMQIGNLDAAMIARDTAIERSIAVTFALSRSCSERIGARSARFAAERDESRSRSCDAYAHR